MGFAALSPPYEPNLRDVRVPKKTAKHSGFDWEVHIVYPDGDDDSIEVAGCATPEEAIAQARAALNAYAKSDDEKDQFEIVAVIRADAEI